MVTKLTLVCATAPGPLELDLTGERSRSPRFSGAAVPSAGAAVPSAGASAGVCTGAHGRVPQELPLPRSLAVQGPELLLGQLQQLQDGDGPRANVCQGTFWHQVLQNPCPGRRVPGWCSKEGPVTRERTSCVLPRVNPLWHRLSNPLLLLEFTPGHDRKGP